MGQRLFSAKFLFTVGNLPVSFFFYLIAILRHNLQLKSANSSVLVHHQQSIAHSKISRVCIQIPRVNKQILYLNSQKQHSLHKFECKLSSDM